MYLFFDTETTGLPRSRHAPVTDTDNWPRLVQLAWLLYDDTGRHLAGSDRIIKPQGFTIPYMAERIHGISTAMAEREGLLLDDVLKEFTEAIDRADTLVAHNMDFDVNVLGAEFIRIGTDNRLPGISGICTMRVTAGFCRLPGPYGYKWPSLEELHLRLFNESFEKAHNAAADAEALARCFFELKRLGVV